MTELFVVVYLVELNKISIINRESRKAGIPAHLNQDLSTNLISDGMVHGLPDKGNFV